MNSDLESILTSPTGTGDWSWVYCSDGRNMDELPDALTPRSGCLRCGSVWVDYVAVAFLKSTFELFLDARVLSDRTGQLYVLGNVSEFVVPVAAVRVRCHEGHEELCHGVRTPPNWPNWQNAGLMALAAWGYTTAKWGIK